MKKKVNHQYILLGITVLGFVFLGTFAFAQSQEQAQQKMQSSWEEQVENTFGLDQGLGRLLMSQEEWQEHHRAMQQMTVAEREQYRQETHSKLTERAKERGITFPDKPRQPCIKPFGGRGDRGSMGSAGGGMGGRGR